VPHSLVLNLLPASSIPPGFTTGKHLHALFLSLVSSVDAQMGDRLHANTANKAFTLSPLQRSPLQRVPHPNRPIVKKGTKKSLAPLGWNHLNPIAPGTPCWWRISLLDDGLFGHLSQLWLNLNPEQPWHLGPANLHIASVLGTPQSTQPWANFCSYAQLYERASITERKLTLQFCTPTAFRQGKYDSALPTPERVLGSLLRRWNHFSEMPFPSEILEVVQDSHFNIRTEIAMDPRSQFQHLGARTDPRNSFTGSVGKVTFQILGKVDPTTIQQLNTLADFAIYAGVGRKTPMGMGMVRRVEDEG
jgi:CRISPR-associated endoribonuclease Cas6